MITNVTPDGWAERNGVKPGDILLTMNGRNFEKMTSHEIFQQMRTGKKPIKMEFKRPASVHLNQEAIKSGKAVSVDLTEDPADPTKMSYEFECKGAKSLGMRTVGSEIVHVLKDSWASIHKVEVDDEIVEIGGKLFDALTDAEKTDQLEDGAAKTIKFRRPKFKDSYYDVSCTEMKLGLKYFKLEGGLGF